MLNVYTKAIQLYSVYLWVTAIIYSCVTIHTRARHFWWSLNFCYMKENLFHSNHQKQLWLEANELSQRLVARGVQLTAQHDTIRYVESCAPSNNPMISKTLKLINSISIFNILIWTCCSIQLILQKSIIIFKIDALNLYMEYLRQKDQCVDFEVFFTIVLGKITHLCIFPMNELQNDNSWNTMLSAKPNQSMFICDVRFVRQTLMQV